MAGGNNEKFRSNPLGFMRDHDFIVSPAAVTNPGYNPPNNLPTGAIDLDLVTLRPGVIRLERFHARAHHDHFRAARPVRALFLGAALNTAATLPIDNSRDFVLTNDLSGCLFAAYGPSRSHFTIEHVNDRAGTGTIDPRIAALAGGGHPFLLMLSNRDRPHIAHHHRYTVGTWVLGIRSPANTWRFWFKPDPHSIFEMR